MILALFSQKTNKRKASCFMPKIYAKYSQDRLDPVLNKGQDVTLCEFVHRTSNCFRCYPSNQ